MQKKTGFVLAIVGFLLWGGLRVAQAQEESADAKSGKPNVVQPYRLDFSFNELEGDKKVNTRHYTMNLTSAQAHEIKIGSRVPVASGTTKTEDFPIQFQYLDVGTTIWAQLRPIANSNEEELVVRSEVSNLDMTSEAGSASRIAPVIRRINIDGSTLVTLGKSLLIGSMDDPNSKRQFQLEVVVTRLK
jgi:type II secretory pathway component GspD/PulD (secretin)